MNRGKKWLCNGTRLLTLAVCVLTLCVSISRGQVRPPGGVGGNIGGPGPGGIGGKIGGIAGGPGIGGGNIGGPGMGGGIGGAGFGGGGREEKIGCAAYATMSSRAAPPSLSTLPPARIARRA
ncbi:MAG: hypothetical protein EXR98_23620 [Gemmataceae bacterium]|nr:hypothetical protein [Gemmataceae bacterium]